MMELDSRVVEYSKDRGIWPAEFSHGIERDYMCGQNLPDLLKHLIVGQATHSVRGRAFGGFVGFVIAQ